MAPFHSCLLFLHLLKAPGLPRIPLQSDGGEKDLHFADSMSQMARVWCKVEQQDLLIAPRAMLTLERGFMCGRQVSHACCAIQMGICTGASTCAIQRAARLQFGPVAIFPFKSFQIFQTDRLQRV